MRNQKQIDKIVIGIVISIMFVWYAFVPFGTLIQLRGAFNIINSEFISSDDEGSSLKDFIEDPHSSFYTPKQAVEFFDSINNTLYGIGVSTLDTKEGYIEVIEVYDGGAKEAGIEPTDIILEVNNQDILALGGSAYAIELIKGEVGTNVNLTVQKQNGQIQSFDVERGEVHIPFTYATSLDDRTGYIALDSFGTNSYQEFKQDLDKLEKTNMDHLIIDLRFNPGGSLEELSYFIDEFIVSDQPWMITLDKKGNKDNYYSNGSDKKDYEITILINENSASASEIFAVAMQQLGGYTLVGKTTYGKGSMQSVFPLFRNAIIKATTQIWYGPGMYEVNGVGVTPDIEVEQNPLVNDYKYRYERIKPNDEQLNQAWRR